MIGPHLAFFPPCLAADLLRLGWAAGNQLPLLGGTPVFSGRGGGEAGGRWNCLAVAGGKLSRSLLLVRWYLLEKGIERPLEVYHLAVTFAHLNNSGVVSRVRQINTR